MKTQPIKIIAERNLWSKLGVTKKIIVNTPKLFYNKYAFKADLWVDGGYMYRMALYYKTFDRFEEYIKLHKSRRYEYNGLNILQLYSLSEAQTLFGKKIRIRAEGKNVSICAESEEILYNILKSTSMRGHIRKIYRPSNKEAMTKIENNVMFVKKPKFKFRVMIRSGVYSLEIKKQVLNYLENHKDSIIVTNSIIDNLKINRNTYMAGYFHVNDTDVLLFLKMIVPRFIGKIFQLEVFVDK
jgi:hypothetical protein